MPIDSRGFSVPPWTPEEVCNLNEWQQEFAIVHPFTCGTEGCGGEMRATESGWECACGYSQNWAHAFMADGSALKSMKVAMGLRKGE